jgi:hypothetical protein
MELPEAKASVKAYRDEHPEIVRGWATCNDAIPYLLIGGEFKIDPWGLCTATKGKIITPQGAKHAFVIATNVYHKTAQGWKMVAHHASPGTANDAVDTGVKPTVLH